MKKPKSLFFASAALVFALTAPSFAHDTQGVDGRSQAAGQACMSNQSGFGSQFTEAQRGLLQDTMMQTHSENKPLKEKLHALRKDLHALMLEATFNQRAFLDKSAEAQQLSAEIKQNKVKAYVAVAPQFRPDERKFVWKLFMHRHHHHHGHHWRHGMGHGDDMPNDGEWSQDKNGGMPANEQVLTP